MQSFQKSRSEEDTLNTESPPDRRAFIRSSKESSFFWLESSSHKYLDKIESIPDFFYWERECRPAIQFSAYFIHSSHSCRWGKKSAFISSLQTPTLQKIRDNPTKSASSASQSPQGRALKNSPVDCFSEGASRRVGKQ